MVLNVELFANLSAPTVFSSIFTNGSGFYSQANIRTEFFRLPLFRSTHALARWSLTEDCIVSVPSLLQKAFTSFDLKSVP